MEVDQQGLHSKGEVRMNTRPTFSIIAPIYNEIDNITTLYERVTAVMDPTDEPWEFVMIDDGSSDGSTEAILELSKKDSRIVPVIFARNFGHQIAVTAGLDYSQGEAVIIIDADLQDPPEVILDLIGKWREGYEVVYATRSKREGESWFKLFTAAAFYRLIQRITDVDLPMDTGDFRLLDHKVVEVMNQMRERHRFLRGMSVWVGLSRPAWNMNELKGLLEKPNIYSRRCSDWLVMLLQASHIFHSK